MPWYPYECQRATNATFTGTLQTWPVQAWADGSISVWDDFADLTNRHLRRFIGFPILSCPSPFSAGLQAWWT